MNQGFEFHSDYLEARGEYGVLPKRLRQSLNWFVSSSSPRPIGLGVYENSIEVVLQDSILEYALVDDLIDEDAIDFLCNDAID
mmetsp:Transcript_33469/g.46712  ORF Transcript_33469/g.46712 Transcript_33469/m.46712 type:complete len:83 (+) Transcript_33469:83-331(+)